jgi:hypothetical protein
VRTLRRPGRRGLQAEKHAGQPRRCALQPIRHSGTAIFLPGKRRRDADPGNPANAMFSDSSSVALFFWLSVALFSLLNTRTPRGCRRAFLPGLARAVPRKIPFVPLPRTYSIARLYTDEDHLATLLSLRDLILPRADAMANLRAVSWQSGAIPNDDHRCFGRHIRIPPPHKNSERRRDPTHSPHPT